MPIQTVGLYVFVPLIGNIMNKEPVVPGLVKCFGNHGFFDPVPARASPKEKYGSSTGTQILVTLIANECSSGLSHALNNPSRVDVFTPISTDADDCKCDCSSSGCLPLTIA